MKQTAVKWLVEQLRQLAFNQNTHLGMGDVRVTQGLLDELSEKAKEMEKEQIINAFEIGYDNGACVQEGSAIYHGSNYYNETFKSE